MSVTPESTCTASALRRQRQPDDEAPVTRNVPDREADPVRDRRSSDGHAAAFEAAVG